MGPSLSSVQFRRRERIRKHLFQFGIADFVFTFFFFSFCNLFLCHVRVGLHGAREMQSFDERHFFLNRETGGEGGVVVVGRGGEGGEAEGVGKVKKKSMKGRTNNSTPAGLYVTVCDKSNYVPNLPWKIKSSKGEDSSRGGKKCT